MGFDLRGVLKPFLLFLFTVSRLHCESESFKMDLVLDVNTWMYPMELGKLRWVNLCLFLELGIFFLTFLTTLGYLVSGLRWSYEKPNIFRF